MEYFFRTPEHNKITYFVLLSFLYSHKQREIIHVNVTIYVPLYVMEIRPSKYKKPPTTFFGASFRHSLENL